MTEALDRLVALLEIGGSAIRSRLRPDDDLNDIAVQLEDAGLEPLDDLVHWFAYTNGLGPDPANLATGDGNGLFHVYHPVTLDEALSHRQEILDDPTFTQLGPDPAVWRPSMLPILRPDPDIAIDTAPGPDQGRLFHLVWEGPAEPVADSLTAFVDAQTQALETGEHVIAAGGRILHHTDPTKILEWSPTEFTVFKPGQSDLDQTTVRVLGRWVKAFYRPEREYQIRRLPTGSVPGNDGLEALQLQLTYDLLVELGMNPDRLSTGIDEDRRIGHAHKLQIYIRRQ